MPRTIKVRTLVEQLRALGCTPVRTEGSHQVWSIPGAGHVPIVINHANADVSRRVLATLLRALRRAGLRLAGPSGAKTTGA